MADQTLTIEVNGEQVEVQSGQLLLHVLRAHGVVVPTLCHDDRLTPYGGCRLCVVARIDGRGGLIPACSTPVQKGMKIETDPPEVIASRRRQLQLLVLNHRMECPICDRRGDCRLQDLVFEYGVPEEALPFELVRAPTDTASRVIVRDPEKCIICGKCVRICDEVQGVAAIGLKDRGLGAQVSTFNRRPLDCEFCGQCVNACPVAALVARPYTCEVPAWLRTSTTTTCSFCSSGCQVQLETWEEKPQAAIPAIGQEPNRGKLCVKGWLGWDLLKSPGRLTKPLVRRDGRLEEASWEEALGRVVDALAAAKTIGRQVVGLGSPRLTTEDAYTMQRFMRSVVGTPHVCAGPVGGTKALTDGAARATGVASSTAGYTDLAEADEVLVLRADPTRTHPLVKTEIVQRKKQRGQDFMLAHSLSGGLELHAGLYLKLNPSSEEVLLRGACAQLLAHKPELRQVHGEIEGFKQWAESLEVYTPERVCAITGISAGQYERFVQRLSISKKLVIAVVCGTGIPGDEAAVTREAAYLLSLLRGPENGSGLMVLGEKANVQGVIDVGLYTTMLPGHRPVDSEKGRQEVEAAWNSSLPTEVAWNPDELCSRIADRQASVLYLAGQDPISGWPNECPGHACVAGADTVIVQEAFLTATARQADVVLPVRILGERSGSVVSLDGRRRGLNRVFTPEGGLPQDGDLFRELARRMGTQLPSGQDLEVEIGKLMQWPCGPAPVTHFEVCPEPAEALVFEEFMLDASPQLFHSGTMTSRSPHLQELAPAVAARVNPEDAATWGVKSGEMIRVMSESKEVTLRARIDRNVRAGTVVVPWSGDGSVVLLESSEKALKIKVRRSR